MDIKFLETVIYCPDDFHGYRDVWYGERFYVLENDVNAIYPYFIVKEYDIDIAFSAKREDFYRFEHL